MKKFVALLLCILVLFSIAACGTTPSPSTQPTGENDGEKTGEKVSITFLNQQPGVDDAYLALLDKFMEDNPDIHVEYIMAGSDILQQWQGMYAANKAPTVSFIVTYMIANFNEYFYRFDETKVPWLSKVKSGLDLFTFEDGAPCAIPSSLQGIGLIYNKRIVAEVFGEDFDVDSVDTRDKLESFFADLAEAGYTSTMMHGASWALTDHYFGVRMFSDAIGDKEAQYAYLNGLKEGTLDLVNDQHFNDVMDTLDLLVRYNYHSEDPLLENVEMDAAALKQGEVATWYQGDWMWMYINGAVGDESDFGIMHMPYSNDASNPINTMVSAYVPGGYVIDVTQNTEAQQEAGLRLIEYLCFSEAGQEVMGVMLGSSLPYDEILVENPNPLARSIQGYYDAGRTFDVQLFSLGIPNDFSYSNQAAMQRYLVGDINRVELAQAMMEYWQTVK